MEQELEQLEGTVEDIIYENSDNGYTVFEVSGGGVMTVVCGVVGELHAGETVICRGKYENHATYGRQFSHDELLAGETAQHVAEIGSYLVICILNRAHCLSNLSLSAHFHHRGALHRSSSRSFPPPHHSPK